MTISRRSLPLAAASLLLLALGGCDSIGEGNNLERVEIFKLTGVIEPSRNKLFVCFREQLQLQGEFTNGLRGNFTDRAFWSSDNPAVVQVSNGDIAVPGETDQFFASGHLLPKTQGTATITAQYLGLRATFDVVVDAPPTDIAIQVASATMAPNSVQLLTARATFDAFNVNITDSAEWSFENEDTEETPNSDIATIARPLPGSVVVRAIEAGHEPRMIVARFLGCSEDTDPATPNLDARTTIGIENPVARGNAAQNPPDADNHPAVTLEREFGGYGGELVVGTSDRLRVLAWFDDNTTQDLSSSITLQFTQAATSFGVLAAVMPSTVLAQAAGSGTIVGCFDPQPTHNDDNPADDTGDSAGTCTATDPNRLLTNPIDLTAVTATLESFTIAPLNETIEARDEVPFRATGIYTGRPPQDITRHVNWTSSDTSVAVIGNATSRAGVAASLQTTDGAVTITATQTNATVDDDAETQLCINAPGSTAACPRPNP